MLTLLLSSIAFAVEPKFNDNFKQTKNEIETSSQGKIEVIELFWYGCGHCFNLAPVVSKWAKQQDSSVNYQKMPVTWGPVHQLHAKLFYTIEALGVGDTAHSAVFAAMHKEGNFLASEGAILKFLEKLGMDRSETIKYMNSFSVRQKVKRATELSKQFKVTATPMIFIDGRYRIEAKGGHSKMLKVVDHVIALQKPVS